MKLFLYFSSWLVHVNASSCHVTMEKSLLTPFLLLQGHNCNHGKKHNKDYQSYLYAMKCVYIVINVTIVYMILSSLLWPISYTTIYQGSARKMMFIENKQSWANKNLNFWRSFTYCGSSDSVAQKKHPLFDKMS